MKLLKLSLFLLLLWTTTTSCQPKYKSAAEDVCNCAENALKAKNQLAIAKAGLKCLNKKIAYQDELSEKDAQLFEESIRSCAIEKILNGLEE